MIIFYLKSKYVILEIMAKTKKKETNKYSVTLLLEDGREFNGQGDTLLEAMSQIKLDEIICNLGTLTAIYKDKKVEQVVNASRLQRMFGQASESWLHGTALATYSDYLLSGLI